MQNTHIQAISQIRQSSKRTVQPTKHGATVLIAALLLMFLSYSIAMADSPANLTTDIDWDVDNATAGVQQRFETVDDIQNAFNHARRQEEIQLGLTPNQLGNLELPPQASWQAMSSDERALFLINAERTARANSAANIPGLPLQQIESNLDTIAQNYADLLLNTNSFDHDQDGSPFDRLDAVFGAPGNAGACREFMSRAENLALFVTSGGTIPMPIERAVYNWIYVDAASSWGHREAVLLQDLALNNPLVPPNMPYGFKNNYQGNDSEGFLGIGYSEGSGYVLNGQSWNLGAIVVMNIIDPSVDPACTMFANEPATATPTAIDTPTPAAETATPLPPTPVVETSTPVPTAPTDTPTPAIETSTPIPTAPSSTPTADVATSTPIPTAPTSTPIATAPTSTPIATAPANGKANITIIIDVEPNADLDFRYYGAFSEFLLDDPAVDDGDTTPKSIRYQNVTPGTYSFSEVYRAPWQVTAIECSAPDRVTVSLKNRSVTISPYANEDITCTFVNKHRVNIEAQSYHDFNSDGTKQDDEPALAGWAIHIYDASNNLVFFTVTDSDGKAGKERLSAGEYKVCQVMRAEWFNSQPAEVDEELKMPCVDLVLEPGSAASVPFGNTQAPVESNSLTGLKKTAAIFTLSDFENESTGEEADAQVRLFLPTVMR